MTIPNKVVKEMFLRNPEARRIYEEITEELALASELIATRARAGLTQAQLAKRMGTTQSAIARLESGRLPSVKTLQRFAKATGTRPVVKFVPLAKAKARRKSA
jgi:transcriptional regulator with XRE-family HTH domain